LFKSHLSSSPKFRQRLLKLQHYGALQNKYLRDLLRHYDLPHITHLLHQPYVPTSVSSRAFSVAAPTVWNQLTVNTRTANTLGTFKARLKTELFALPYPTYDISAASPQRFRFTSSSPWATNANCSQQGGGELMTLFSVKKNYATAKTILLSRAASNRGKLFKRNAMIVIDFAIDSRPEVISRS